MKRWARWGWYQATPKKPPPVRGIKVKKTGATWWGQRWIDALERMSAGYSNRLARGRTYARAGRTHDLAVKAGRVTAKVTGSRSTPYTVTIQLAKLSDAAWTKAIAAMAAKAQFAAELLAGQMPREVDEAFESSCGSVFPTKEADLVTDCSCPDWANPCKHVAATHYVLGEALDRDPFLLFELRGRTKDQVLEALRAARSDAGPASGAKGRAKTTQAAKGEIPSVTVGKVKRADYDRSRAPTPMLRLSFDPPSTHGAMLRQLGAPAVWSGEDSPADLLSPLVRAAAKRARQIALAEVEAPEPVGSDAVNVASGKFRTTGRSSGRG
jgi:uncharacterized Zn finger protein